MKAMDTQAKAMKNGIAIRSCHFVAALHAIRPTTKSEYFCVILRLTQSQRAHAASAANKKAEAILFILGCTRRDTPETKWQEYAGDLSRRLFWLALRLWDICGWRATQCTGSRAWALYKKDKPAIHKSRRPRGTGQSSGQAAFFCDRRESLAWYPSI